VSHRHEDDPRQRVAAATDHERLEAARREGADREWARLLYAEEAGHILESSLDYETTLKELGHLVVPGLADWYAVDLVDDDGGVTNLAVAHVDPAKVELARELRERFPPRPDEPTSAVQIARSGTSQWIREIPDALLEQAASDPELLAILRDLGLRSVIAVPLVARGRAFGSMTMITAESGRLYDEADLRLAEELGRRAGLAIDNARLFTAERDARTRAEDAEARLQALSAASRALGESLDLEVTLQKAADLATKYLADSSTVYLAGEDGTLRGMAFATTDPERAADLARFNELYDPGANRESHVGRALASHETQVVEHVDVNRAADVVGGEAGEILRTLQVRSGMSIPLIISGRAVGVLALAWEQQLTPNQLDVAFAEELARRMARAIENARLVAAERRASRRVTLVSRVTSALSASLDYEQGLHQLAELVTEELADFCLLDILDEDGSVRRLSVIHRDPTKQHIVEGLQLRPPALEGSVPAAVAMRTRRIVREDVREEVLASIAEDEQHLELMRQIGGVNFLALPLIARDRVLGALTISSTSRAYDDQDVALASEIAGRGAVHLDNTRLYAAQARAMRQAARLQAIVDATFGSDTLDGLLHTLLERVMTTMGTDAAAILLMDEHEPVLRMRAAVGQAEDVQSQVSVPVGKGFAGRIAATRQPLAVEDVASFGVVSAYLKERLRSIVGVPLMVDREIVGVLHTASATSRVFDADDISLLQLAAERAAVTIRRRELFERQQEIATMLQASFLPTELPSIPGVELSTLFVAAGRGVDVGGDFYDVFAIDDTTWGLAVGDVCGRGPQAAALTGLARNGLRAIAMREPAPDEVLTRLNETMVRSAIDRFCTVAFATIEPRSDGVGLALARGGHPPPHVLRADGAVEVLRSPGPLLGVFAEPTFAVDRLDLMPGDTVVLFTDGLVERNERLDREGGLARLLGSLAGLDAAAITDRLGDTLDGPPESSRDDVAVVVARVRPEDTKPDPPGSPAPAATSSAASPSRRRGHGLAG
jgi:GAF domain-containing protein